MQELKLRIKGLYTHPSDLSAVPEGALSIANNIVIDHEEIAEPRRGYNRSNAGFSSLADTAKKLTTYQSYLFAHLASNILVYYTTQLSSNTANFSGTGAWTTVGGGSYSAPSGTKMRFVEANQNLYATTSAGIYKFDAYNATPVLAGGYKGLDIQATLVDVAGDWLTTGYGVAYRVLWGIKDANKNLVQGAPSQRATVANTSGSPRCVQIKTTIPAGVTTAWFYQLYRSAMTINATNPNDELQLVYEANPTSGDLSNQYVQFNDIVPDELRGAIIYTAATQEGLANGNERPPLAKDMAVYRNVTFYANTTSKQRQYVSLLAVGGTNGLKHNDTVTVGGVVYTAKFNTELAASGQFAIDTLVTTGNITSGSNQLTSLALSAGITVGQTITGTGIPASTTVSAVVGATVTMSANATASTTGVSVTISTGASASQSITDAALSLTRVVNQYSSSTIYAYYQSGPDDLPGKMLFEERSIGGGTISTTGNNTTCWSPAIGVTAATSTNDQFKHAIFYSKTSQPEAVPLPNYFLVGSAQKQILRILTLKDSLFILKEDGVFRLSGQTAANFRVDLFDSTTHLLAPDTAAVLNNQIYAMTDQGVVAISESGVQVRSRPIEYDLLSLQGQNYAVLQTESFGVSYETERKYVLFVPTLAADTTPTQAYVFNTFTNTWTRWTLTKTCGIVNSGDDKLYLGDAATNYVNQERKSFSYQDYVDYGFSTAITAVSGRTLTINNSDQISAGDVIYQSSSVYSTVDSVDSVAGTVVTTVTAAFTAAATDVLKAISSSIAWVPFASGNAGMLKQFREVSVLFKSDFTGTGTLVFASDASPNQESETLIGTGIGTWGLFTWGTVGWGGTNRRRPIRVYVPSNKQRCSQLTINFQHSTGYAKYQLNGLSLIGNFESEKVAY